MPIQTQYIYIYIYIYISNYKSCRQSHMKFSVQGLAKDYFKSLVLLVDMVVQHIISSPVVLILHVYIY